MRLPLLLPCILCIPILGAAARVIIDKLTSHCVMLNGYVRRCTHTAIRRLKEKVSAAIGFFPFLYSSPHCVEMKTSFDGKMKLVSEKSAACTRAFDIVI
jgi:hypothetical protein